MGQAKQRGTYEERVAQAKARVIAPPKTKPAEPGSLIVTPRPGRGRRSPALLAALALGGAVPGMRRR